jgi:hypothetical protein
MLAAFAVACDPAPPGPCADGSDECNPAPAQPCADGTADCDGDPANACETKLASTLAHCGACGNACPSPDHATSACTAGACGFACEPGWADCDGDAANGCEVDTRSDVARCGACDSSCAPADGAAVTCIEGNCGFTCEGDRADCDGEAVNGCEIDVGSDASHCGACDAACAAREGASAACVSRECTYACDAGRGDCDGEPANGCEADLSDTLAHCGACNSACPARPNATSACTAASCGFTCEAGWGDCDGDPANGCERNLLTSADHCGTCGRACPVRDGSAPACAGGSCGIECDTDKADCDALLVSGCEVSLTSDVRNCLGCGLVCEVPFRAAPVCAAQGCGYACELPYLDCDGSPADGCETDPRTDVDHCGACDNACPAPGFASATCEDSSCGFACLPGRLDCAGGASDGCEVDGRSDPDHCGACGNACPAPINAARTCDGTCGFTCLAGFGDCDGDAANGCETDLSTAAAHCGSCGNACAAPPSADARCEGSTCGFSCRAGYGDCDGSAANGCEEDLLTSVQHCGGCGNDCSAPPNAMASCDSAGDSSACDYDCDTGYGDCDNDAANGCEVPLNTTSDCGSCGAACVAGDACGAEGCTACGLATTAGLTLSDGVVSTYTGAVSGTSRFDSQSCQANTKGPEVIIPFTLASARTVAIELAGYDTVLSVRRQCAHAPSELGCDHDGGAGTESALRVRLDAGSYYAVVDEHASTATTVGGDLTARFLAYTPVAHAACAGALALTGAGLTGEDLSLGAISASKPCLSGSAGPSLYYRYSLPPATEALLTLTPTSAIAPYIRVFEGCAANTCVASDSSSIRSITARTVSLSNRTSTPRVLTVEVSAHENPLEAGSFDLSVTETSLAIAPNASCESASDFDAAQALTGQVGGRGGIATSACASYTGFPLYYRVNVPAYTALTVTATPDASTPGYDPALRAFNACGATPACLGAANTAGAGAAESLRLGNATASPTEVYFSVAGATSSSTTGVFALSATTSPAAANGVCAAATTLTPGTPLTGQNCLGGSAGSTQCTTSYEGRALYYKVTVPPLTALNVTVTPEGTGNLFNPTLRVASTCEAATCLASVNVNGAGLAESSLVENRSSAPVDYLVTVAGSTPTSGEGPFTLSAESEQIVQNTACLSGEPLVNGSVYVNQDLSRGGDAQSGTSCFVSAARTLWYSAVIPARHVLSVRAQPQGPWDPAIRILSACSSTSCLAGSANFSANVLFGPEVLAYTNTGTNPLPVVINVTSASATLLGRFDLEARIAPPINTFPPVTTNDACATGTTPITGSTSLYGTTADATNTLAITSSGCSGLSSTANGAQTYLVTVPAGQRLSALATPLSNYNIGIRLYEGCPGASGAVCLTHSDKTSLPGAAEAFTFTNTSSADTTLTLLVGSASSSASFKGPYALSLEIGPGRYAVNTGSPAACTDMTNATTLVMAGTGGDTWSVPQEMPFSFQYFGKPVRSFVAATDGYISLSETTRAWAATGTLTNANVALPFPMPANGMVAPFWDDLGEVIAGANAPRVLVTGSAPSRKLTVQWNMRLSIVSGALRFQAQFDETTNAVAFHYCSIPAGSGSYDGASATIGLESLEAGDSVPFWHSALSQGSATGGYPGGLNGKSFRFTPPAPPP